MMIATKLISTLTGALALVLVSVGFLTAKEAMSPVSEMAAVEQDAQWETRAPLPERRTEVSAATDGERIYLAGGFTPPEVEGERASSPRTLWAYMPADDSWEALTELPEGVHHAPFVHLDGRLYILGGFRETSFDPVANVRIYDIASGTWSEGAPMPTPRGASGFTVHDGHIHVIGGNVASADDVAGRDGVVATEDNSVNVHEVYDPATDTWRELTPMPTPRNHLGAATANGRVHALLGRVNDDTYTMTTHEIYDVETDTWTTGPDVPTGRSGVAVLERDGYVYAFGGENLAEGESRTYDSAERFNTSTNEWEELPPMPTSRHGLGAVSFGEGIYVISGGPEPAFNFGDANEFLVLEE